MSAVGLIPVIGVVLVVERFGRKIFVRHTGAIGPSGAKMAGQDSLVRFGDGGLVAHELDDEFHAIKRHAFKTDEQLQDRVVTDNLRKASSFVDLAAAERYTYANLGTRDLAIRDFLESSAQSLQLRTIFDHSVGRTMVRGSAGIVDPKIVVTVIQKDSSMPAGFRIVTSYSDVE